jgi:hypothetical protein
MLQTKQAAIAISSCVIAHTTNPRMHPSAIIPTIIFFAVLLSSRLFLKIVSEET